MIIKSIFIKEGLFSRNIEFSRNVNLIHSKKNSTGKTTLLRFILYSLGYSIPSTRKIKFEQCEVKLTINNDKVGDIILTRLSNHSIILNTKAEQVTFVLPEQQKELHSFVFNTNNENVLNNLLGAFYVDQEKGWTLLNRGIVIGSIHFNIEEFIRGLSNRDCDELIKQENSLSRELGKYRQMFSIAKYQETIEQEEGSLVINHYDDKVNLEIEQLRIKQNLLKEKLKSINQTIKDNRQFSNYISKMKLLIEDADGKIIPVHTNNIVGFEDGIDFLIAKHKMVSAELESVSRSIINKENYLKSNNELLSFWNIETMAQAFDKRILSLQLNVVQIEKEIRHLEKKLSEVRKIISDKTKINNGVINSLYSNVVKYAKELGVFSDEQIDASYLFTSNLKELSGAELHKTIFSFRLAYIIEVQQNLGIKLPIILDSPSGKEVDKENIRMMMRILKRDFSDYQIIIASIFEYDFNEINIIEINERLIEV